MVEELTDSREFVDLKIDGLDSLSREVKAVSKPKTLALILTSCAALYGAAYSGHRLAVKANSYVNIMYLMSLRQQWGCYEDRDWDCVKLSTLIAADLAAMWVSAHSEAGILDDSANETAAELLQWQSELQDLSSAQNQAHEARIRSDTVSSDRVSKVLRVTPYAADGQIIGYRAFSGEDRDAFEQLGLQPGDLIVKIDGESIRDVQSMADAGGQLRSGVPVTFTINRAGDLIDVVASFPKEE